MTVTQLFEPGGPTSRIVKELMGQNTPVGGFHSDEQKTPVMLGSMAEFLSYSVLTGKNANH